jgi:hypothetical protein
VPPQHFERLSDLEDELFKIANVTEIMARFGETAPDKAEAAHISYVGDRLSAYLVRALRALEALQGKQRNVEPWPEEGVRIGDELFVWHDPSTGRIVLRKPHETGEHRIELDPPSYGALRQWITRWSALACRMGEAEAEGKVAGGMTSAPIE